MKLACALHALEKATLPRTVAEVGHRRGAAGAMRLLRDELFAVGILVSGAAVGVFTVALGARSTVEAGPV